MPELGTAFTASLTSLSDLVTGNIGAILAVAVIIVGATVLWRLARRFIR
jgi:type IV secretory pathway VirB2 component (pilin)